MSILALNSLHLCQDSNEKTVLSHIYQITFGQVTPTVFDSFFSGRNLKMSNFQIF